MTLMKCGHERCQCAVDGDDYCSDYCEDRGGTPGVDVLSEACQCGHPACADG